MAILCELTDKPQRGRPLPNWIGELDFDNDPTLIEIAERAGRAKNTVLIVLQKLISPEQYRPNGRGQIESLYSKKELSKIASDYRSGMLYRA